MQSCNILKLCCDLANRVVRDVRANPVNTAKNRKTAHKGNSKWRLPQTFSPIETRVIACHTSGGYKCKSGAPSRATVGSKPSEVDVQIDVLTTIVCLKFIGIANQR